MSISVLDIGLGNIGSITKALKHTGFEYQICRTPEDVVNAKKIIFPGVGNFSEASVVLKNSGLRDAIRHAVLIEKVPFLGICLGMQLIATRGFEGEASCGLDLISAEVSKIPKHKGAKIPHVGWNDISHDQCGLFSGIPDNADFYFVHSYRMELNDSEVSCFHVDHGSKIVAYVEKGNIYGAQFHPEKSQDFGLKFLRNFCALC